MMARLMYGVCWLLFFPEDHPYTAALVSLLLGFSAGLALR